MGRIYDIITVGSATIDVFVKTHAEIIEVKHKHTEEEFLAYPVGKKLLVEDMHQEVGGSAINAGTAFARMGFKTAYFGALAKDNYAKDIMNQLSDEKIDFIGARKDGQTNYSVILDSQHDDRTILVYKDVSNKIRAKDFKNDHARWFYLTTLKDAAYPTLVKMAKHAKLNSSMVALNFSSYLAKAGLKYLRPLLENIDVLIFNKNEARILLKTHSDEQTMLKKLRNYVTIPVITDGKHGVWVYHEDKIWNAKPKKNLRIVETTGAGDAFASGFVSGLMMMKPIKDCIKLGMLNSESVISHIGAKNILLDRKHAERLLKSDKREIHKYTA